VGEFSTGETGNFQTGIDAATGNGRRIERATTARTRPAPFARGGLSLLGGCAFYGALAAKFNVNVPAASDGTSRTSTRMKLAPAGIFTF
jgi:hypothetical protein